MKAIVLAIASGQDFEKVKHQLIKIANQLAVFENPTIVIHGFMPRKLLEEKQMSLDLINLLDSLFPIQLNLYQEKALIKEIIQVGLNLNAMIYVIGAIKNGLIEEEKLDKAFSMAGLPIIHHPIL